MAAAKESVEFDWGWRIKSTSFLPKMSQFFK